MEPGGSGAKDEEKMNGSVKSQEETQNTEQKLQSGATSKSNEGKDACNSCSVFGKSKKASSFCYDCLELLCEPCSIGRHSSKSARNHKFIDLDAKKEDSKKK